MSDTNSRAVITDTAHANGWNIAHASTAATVLVHGTQLMLAVLWTTLGGIASATLTGNCERLGVAGAVGGDTGAAEMVVLAWLGRTAAVGKDAARVVDISTTRAVLAGLKALPTEDPHRVETDAQLDTLPVGTVVRDPEGRVWRHAPVHGGTSSRWEVAPRWEPEFEGNGVLDHGPVVVVDAAAADELESSEPDEWAAADRARDHRAADEMGVL